MADGNPEQATSKGMVGHTAAEADRTLLLLWDQREYEIAKAILRRGYPHGAEMAQSEESAKDILLEEIPEVSEAISVAATANQSADIYSGNREVSLAEEPDVGNPQVRFREGHSSCSHRMKITQ